MEEDDDMIVVVVGDDDEVEFKGEPGKICAPIPVKEEPLDEDEVIEIIATAEKYGRPIEFEIDQDTYIVPELLDDTFQQAFRNIKEEVYTTQEDDTEGYKTENDTLGDESLVDPYGIEALEDYNADDDDVDYQVASDEEPDSSVESDDNSGKDDPNRNRRKMLSPSLRKSFIDDLRQRYPELKKNPKALVKTLVEIMRNNKPPKPPKDYFIINDMMYECVKCGKHTHCIPAASRHYQEKHGPRYLVCYACGVDFRSKTNLYKHEKRCPAPDAMVLLRARAMFLGRKARSRPFIPDLRDVPVLKPKSHKRFPCWECSATFTTKNNLIAHENMHNGVRPYCCDQCPRAYTSASALTRHLKIHSDQQFICDHCNASFKIKAALVAHLDTHAPIPKHACTLCPQRYATKNALNHHVRRVHLQLPMPCACQVCPKRYPRMSLLRDHMKKKHGMSLMTRKMFFKALPTLTESQLQQAKAILKADGPLINLSADISKWVQS
ncbi:hypothetical protein ABMA28_017052 [Loxostege sticticalis]|uniref:C2H2-type domain-containing protein n=1 Tax=Loxostege sticticalis TaxID=481309 RepID=A0ABD0TAN6_LOXSC